MMYGHVLSRGTVTKLGQKSQFCHNAKLSLVSAKPDFRMWPRPRAHGTNANGGVSRSEWGYRYRNSFQGKNLISELNSDHSLTEFDHSTGHG